MVLSEIKKYLQTFHMELREDILQELKEQKQKAMVALIIIASAWPIYHHIQNRKLKEIYLVLENDKLKTCTVMNTNMKNKNLKDAD